ncbi:MAG: Crp/Fnr family transcriptional regulator [Candidatus Eremiobacteraeota bacterium]|nr:Crp/Fnr family transcriptional regulator [Candidatus Eremiobacteraeota bacterium]
MISPRFDAMTTNLWIEALPAASRDTLLDITEPVTLRRRETLHDSRGISAFTYFPISTVLSMVVDVGNGKTVEVLMVGREGYCPVTASLVRTTNPIKTVVQIAGEALAVEHGAFDELLKKDPVLAEYRARYLAVMFDDLMQSTACNAVHSVRERCARWLLSLSDRTQSHDINVIHQVLAETLGASRPRVTEILATLQQDGLLELQRATLRIVDSKGLRAASCGCYAIIKSELNGWASPARPV